jgi:riboflavin kinase / FMN adenylyltransferase
VSGDAARFAGPGHREQGPSAVAVGVFDGLHLGHRAILERAVAHANQRAARCVVVSFDPHPDVVLKPGGFRYLAPLTPLQEKRERLLAMGVDELRVIPFTRELAALEPERFVRDYLVWPHQPYALVVGADFALGRGRAGTVERLRTIGEDRGFEVEAVPLLEMDGAPISSTRVREHLSAGQVGEAARLLGRRYSLRGSVVSGHGIGRTLGYPTANLRLHEEKLVPTDGIYVVRARLGEEPEWRPGAMSIGVRPTFDGRERQIEIFLLDWSGELLGTEMEIEFVDWLRPEHKFDSPEALVVAMDQDIADTRRKLGLAEGRPVGG